MRREMEERVGEDGDGRYILEGMTKEMTQVL